MTALPALSWTSGRPPLPLAARRSMLYSSALRASRGSYMVPAQKRPTGSALPSLKRVVVASCAMRTTHSTGPPQLRPR